MASSSMRVHSRLSISVHRLLQTLWTTLNVHVLSLTKTNDQISLTDGIGALSKPHGLVPSIPLNLLTLTY